MPRPSRPTGRHRAATSAVAAAVAVTGLAGVAGGLGAGTSSGSSHREAPFIAGDPQVDNTDVYAFVSPDDASSVTLIANWIPNEEPNGGPTFYPFANGAHHDIEIDNDGDAVADVIYRWTFRSTYQSQDTFLYNTGVVTTIDDPDLNFRQFYDLTVSRDGGAFTSVATDKPVAPSHVGPKSMPDYNALRAAAIVDVGSSRKSFAGQADDPFFLDIRVFDLLYGGDLSLVGENSLHGYNVNTIALKVPKADLALNGDAVKNPVIGVISTTSRPGVRTNGATGSRLAPVDSGAYVQLSRLGHPLVNEVLVPVSSKDLFNASRPTGDAAFLPLVQDPEVPKLIELIYKVPNPNKRPDAVNRPDLVEVFLKGVSIDGSGPSSIEADLNAHTLNDDAVVAAIKPSEQLRLNMSVPPTAAPKRLGVLDGDLAGFPNGRRLTDDVVDIELKVLQGALYGVDTTVFNDKVDNNDLPFTNGFPYVANPYSGAVNRS